MRSGEKKYDKVVETLMSEIAGGKYGDHTPFPSVAMLMRRFGISRLTAVKVLGQLKQRGVVCSHQGRGTFVTKSALARKIGLIVPGMAYSEFFPPVVSAISRAAQESGHSLLFADISSSDPDRRAE